MSELIMHRALVAIIGLPLALVCAILQQIVRRNGLEAGDSVSIPEALREAWKSPEHWEAYRNRPPKTPLHPETLDILVRYHETQEAEQTQAGNLRQAAKHAKRRADLIAGHQTT